MSVDVENKTCDLQPMDDTSPIDNAYLQVDENGIFIEPKVGSLVACVFVTKEMAVVVNHSQIRQFQLKIEQTEFLISEKGFLLKKEDETLAKLMTDLLQEIQKMKFTTNTGSTIQLVNQMEFKKIENRFKNLLKDN